MSKKLVIHPPIEIEFEGDGCTWIIDVDGSRRNMSRGWCKYLKGYGFPYTHWCDLFKTVIDDKELNYPRRCEQGYKCSEAEGSLY
jgi:hypothetical protein